MKQYHELIRQVLDHGSVKGDRTGTGTVSSFGHQIRFSLQEGFPLVTTKFTAFRLVAVELLWFLKGKTNIKELLDQNCHIWDEWATESGDLGPVYGKQWRSWQTFEFQPGGDGADRVPTYELKFKEIDQIKELIDGLKTKPNSRRHIVNAWNVADLPDESKSPKENAANGKMALPPCHTMFQFYVSDMSVKERADWYENRHGEEAFWFAGENMDYHAELDKLGAPRQKLSCQLYQRSADLFLGVPFNIASYSLLTHMIAQECNMGVGEFIHTFGDAHIYMNHMEQVQTMLSREFKPLPKLWLHPEVKSVFDFTMDDIRLDGYEHHPAIKGAVAV